MLYINMQKAGRCIINPSKQLYGRGNYYVEDTGAGEKGFSVAKETPATEAEDTETAGEEDDDADSTVVYLKIYMMKDLTIDAEFTADLRDFLQKRGFSHIFLSGIDPKEINDASEPETAGENYWLLPVKPGDERLVKVNELNMPAITDGKIAAMVAGRDNVQYMIKVPLADYNDYLAKR
jgi:hypothetical protein